MSIQEAELKDALAISILLGQLGYPVTEAEAFKKIWTYSKPCYKLFTAKKDEPVVGFIALHVYHQLHHNGPIGRITSFCLDENVRGHGMGSALLEEAERFFNEHGCIKIEVTSNKRRIKTHDYYLHRGYTQTSKHFVKIIGQHWRFEHRFSVRFLNYCLLLLLHWTTKRHEVHGGSQSIF